MYDHSPLQSEVGSNPMSLLWALTRRGSCHWSNAVGVWMDDQLQLIELMLTVEQSNVPPNVEQ
jgi:hypothetical protein